jgi:ABC-type molybdenum transport system ATPase subunit/photorepair protein PhrA
MPEEPEKLAALKIQVQHRPLPLLQQPEKQPAAGSRVTIRVRDLNFFCGEKQILRGISLGAVTGEFVGIVGSNGVLASKAVGWHWSHGPMF